MGYNVYIVGVVASRAQWRFGLQMAIKLNQLNQVKS